MEGLNMFPTYYGNPYTFSMYNPTYPYYQYWNQQPLQSLNFIYNQFSSQIPLEIQNCEANSPSHSSTDSQSSSPMEEAILLNKKAVSRETRSKATKEAVSNNKNEKGHTKLQAQQKENRNVYSNILRNFFRKINDNSKVEKIVKLIIEKRGLSLTADEFFEYVRRLKINHGKYLRFKKLRCHFMDEDLKEHSMLFRILFEHFKTGDFLVQTLTSRKIGKWSVVLHLKGTRQLKQRLFH